MEKTIKQWLTSGDTAPFRYEEGGYYNALIRVPTQAMRCLQCGHEFVGIPEHDGLGWHRDCPKCGGSFDVDLEG